MTAIVIAAAAALGALSRYAVEKVLPNGKTARTTAEP